jgi:disulfide bond formation protein DsbB
MNARSAPTINTMIFWALLVPIALYGSALIAQFGFGLHPCEMCYWQRWPHQAAIVLGVLALLLRSNASAARLLVLLAGIAVLVSGAIGLLHWGVEQRGREWANFADGYYVCTDHPL